MRRLMWAIVYNACGDHSVSDTTYNTKAEALESIRMKTGTLSPCGKSFGKGMYEIDGHLIAKTNDLRHSGYNYFPLD